MTSFVLLLHVACAAYDQPNPRIRVVGDGEQGVVISQIILEVPSQPITCVRAAETEQWLSLRSQFGGGLLQLPEDYADFGRQQLVALRLPSRAVPIEIVVSSEEGVDVVTLDIAQRGDGDEATTIACLFRLERRSCQTAVVMRDLLKGEERTVAVFSGL